MALGCLFFAPAASADPSCTYAASEGLTLTPPECALALTNAPITFHDIFPGGDVYDLSLDALVVPGGGNAVYMGITLADQTLGTSASYVLTAFSSVSITGGLALNSLLTFDVTSLFLAAGELPPGVFLALDCLIPKLSCDASYGLAAIIDNFDGTYTLSTLFALYLDLTVDNGQTFIEQATGPSLIQSVNIAPPNVTPVPEPATLALLGGGLAAMGALRRRRAGHKV